MIRYQIKPSSPEAHIFQVEILIPEPDPIGQSLSLPAWIPGSYMIRDFAKNIIGITASCREKKLGIKQLDKQCWKTDPVDEPVSIKYEVYAWDLSVRMAHLDQTHGYFNGSSLFLEVDGEERLPCQVEILRPTGELYKGWQVATTLRISDCDNDGFGLYEADSYSDLIDHPVEMGSFSLSEFCVGEVKHEVAITGRHAADELRFCSDLEKICSQQAKFFADLPVDRYLFQIFVVDKGYGGLEHRNSTSLICSRDDLPVCNQSEVSESYRKLLALCSHEYFHLWNVKRIRPAIFKQSDLQKEVYTTQLWVFEGVTSYYDELMLVRAGVIDQNSYLDLLAQTVTRVIRGAGRFKQTLEESSFNAWTKFYKQDENAPNSIVSYYTKGALVACSLDLKIRIETEGLLSLDSVMRAFWQKYGQADIGVPENGFEKLAHQVTGLDLKPFFDSALRGTEELPLSRQLSDFGVELIRRAAKNANDKGGFSEKKLEVKQQPSLGVKFSPSGEAKVLQVFDGGAAQHCGLSAGDVLMAINGLRVDSSNVEKLILKMAAGEHIELHAFRRDELMRFEAILQMSEMNTCEISLIENAPDTAVNRRKAWLNPDGR